MADFTPAVVRFVPRALSVVPAFFAGLINTRFKNKAAQFVWLVPAVILVYKFATFPAPSVFKSQFAAVPSINTSEAAL